MLHHILTRITSSARDGATDEEDATLLKACQTHIRQLEWKAGDEGEPRMFAYLYDETRVDITIPNEDSYTIKETKPDGKKGWTVQVKFPFKPPPNKVPESCRLAMKLCRTGWTHGLCMSADECVVREPEKKEENKKRKRVEGQWIWIYEDNGWEAERWYFAVPWTVRTQPALAKLEERFAKHRDTDIATKRNEERKEFKDDCGRSAMSSAPFFGAVAVAVPTYYGIVKDLFEDKEQVDSRVNDSPVGYMSFWNKTVEYPKNKDDEERLVNACNKICSWDDAQFAELYKGGLIWALGGGDETESVSDQEKGDSKDSALVAPKS